MAKRKRPTKREIPNALLYWIGPYSIEWSVDLVNFHSIQFDSFGEYASYCHATGKK